MKKKTLLTLVLIFALAFIGTSYAYWTQKLIIDTHVIMIYPVEIFAPEEETTEEALTESLTGSTDTDVSNKANEQELIQDGGKSESFPMESSKSNEAEETRKEDSEIVETFSVLQTTEAQAESPQATSQSTTESSTQAPIQATTQASQKVEQETTGDLETSIQGENN